MKPITEFPYSTDLVKDPKYFWNCYNTDQLKLYYTKLRKRTDTDLDPLLAIIQEDKKLMSLIRSFVLTADGWCTEIKACVLASIVIARRPKDITEIGVFGGRSLIPMAMTLKQRAIPGKITGIDPYSAEESAKDQIGENAHWWGTLNHAAIKERFLGNVKRFALEPYVTFIEKPSDDVQPMPCDLLHLDGNHSDQALRDAERFGPMVRSGGIAVLDDIRWEGGAVLRAIDSLEDMGFVEAFRVEDWNVMQNTRS